MRRDATGRGDREDGAQGAEIQCRAATGGNGCQRECLRRAVAGTSQCDRTRRRAGECIGRRDRRRSRQIDVADSRALGGGDLLSLDCLVGRLRERVGQVGRLDAVGRRDREVDAQCREIECLAAARGNRRGGQRLGGSVGRARQGDVTA